MYRPYFFFFLNPQYYNRAAPNLGEVEFSLNSFFQSTQSISFSCLFRAGLETEPCNFCSEIQPSFLEEILSSDPVL